MKRVNSILLFLIIALPVQAQWKIKSGPFYYSGHVRDIMIDGNRVFAATERGIFRSADSGMTWVEIGNGLTSNNANVLAKNDTYIFAGTFDGVFRSADNGNNWVKSTPQIVSTIKGITSLLVKGSYLFAGTADGVFRSEDSGATWTKINNGLQTLGSYSVYSLVMNGSYIFASTGHGVYRSGDNGNNWVKIADLVLSLITSGSNIFAGTTENGIIRSADGGTTWYEISGSPEDVAFLTASGSNIFAGTFGSEVYHSSDHGASWNIVYDLYGSVSTLSASQGYVFVGTGNIYGEGRVFRSTNLGVSWDDVSNGFPRDAVLACSEEIDTEIFVGMYDFGVFRSTDNGSNWIKTSDGLVGSVRALAANGSTMFAGTDEGIFKSTNRGENWDKLLTGDIEALIVSGGYLIASADNYIYRGSPVDASGWTKVGNGFPYRDVNSFATVESVVFACTDGGLYRSADFGSNWVRVDVDIPHSWDFNTLVAIDETLFTCSSTESDDVLRSTDGGETWTRVNNGLTNPFVWFLAVNEGNIFASTFDGIFVSKDKGELWTKINNGFIYDVRVGGIFVFQGNIFADTNYGVQSRALSEIATPVISDFVPVSGPPGTSVMINGFDFGASKENNTVRFSGIDAKVLEATSTRIVVEVPAGAITGAISISKGEFTATSAGHFIVTAPTKQEQFLTFDAVPTKILTDPPLILNATASSGLPVAYSPGNSHVTIDGNIATFVAAGRTSIIASQSGDDNFHAASSVTRSFCINPVKPIVTMSASNSASITFTSSASAGNQWYDNDVAISGATNPELTITQPGVYKVRVTVDDCVSEFSDEFVMVITDVEQAAANRIKLYPNPVEDRLTIVGLDRVNGSKLLDATGRELVLSFYSDGQQSAASIQHLTPGMYMLYVQDGSTMRHFKFFKK